MRKSLCNKTAKIDTYIAIDTYVHIVNYSIQYTIVPENWQNDDGLL